MFAVLRSASQRLAVPAAAVAAKTGVPTQISGAMMQTTRGLKTSKAAAKRFIVTGSGRVKHGKAGRRHNTGKKPNKVMRGLREMATVNPSDIQRVRKLLQV